MKTKHQGKIHPMKKKRIKQKSNQKVEEIELFISMSEYQNKPI